MGRHGALTPRVPLWLDSASPGCWSDFVIPAWALELGRKCDGLGERSVALAETERRLERAKRLVPITRVSDLTPLDPLSLPVFAAVTPLAKDLTTHAGKGATKAHARVSAMMEAVERVSAERLPEERLVKASYAALERSGRAPVDPRTLILPPDSAYRPRLSFTWTEGQDFVRGEEVLAPVDAVTSPPLEGLLREVDTNGLASGNTLLEASVHALCEVLERDAVSQLAFVEAFGAPEHGKELARGVDLSTLPSVPAAWVERALSQDLVVTVQTIHNDFAVPIFRVLLDDAHFGGVSGKRAGFVGYGAHPSAGVAVLRAVTEAIQARAGTLQGARDSLGFTRTSPVGSSSARFDDVPSFDHATLQEDWQLLTARVSASGFERLLVFDLTRPEWQLPVVRVRVPGAACFLVNQRRIGWRCLRHLLP
jgi:ribosomal protein S12 methylthiotransferase accessory factor